MMFAAAVAAMLAPAVGTPTAGALRWHGFKRPAQHSSHRVSMDKRAATKARNKKRSKA